MQKSYYNRSMCGKRWLGQCDRTSTFWSTGQVNVKTQLNGNRTD